MQQPSVESQALRDAASSIEIQRFKDGAYAYKVKVYFDNDSAGLEMQTAMSRVQGLAADLDAKYMRETPF